MKPEDTLISEVKQFLKAKHNIIISIPTLPNLIDSKVNLKVLKSNIGSSSYLHSSDQSTQNRYKILIQQIQILLSSSNFDLRAIQEFMRAFNRTINTDIDILQANEVIRGNSFKIKEKLLFRINQISKKTHLLTSTCQKIHDKDDIITFIAIDMKNYLLSIKLIAEQYEQAKTVQINTPLKIDDIYQFQYSSQQHYHDHYEPLLEVLVRLKANMNNLENDVKSANRIDMPLKSVNLLANCKNLLLELQPFLITDQCAFNRLIFHVVTQQSQNIKLISGFYKRHLDFVRSLVYNLFKCVYLGHLFGAKYNQLKDQIGGEKKKIIECIKKIDIGLKAEQYAQIAKILTIQEKKNLQKIQQKIKHIERVICYGHSNVISDYVEQKICKKLNLLLGQKQQVNNLSSLLGDGDKYLNEVKKLQAQQKHLLALKIDIIKHIEVINKKNVLTEKINEMSQYGKYQNSYESEKQNLFRTNMIAIQQKNIKLSTIQSKIREYEKLCRQHKLVQQYFPKLYQAIRTSKQDYLDLETKLLNSYQHMLKERQEKEAQAVSKSERAIKQITDYITNESKLDGMAYSSIGGEILNQDQHCHKVKHLLGLVDSAQYLLKHTQKKSVQTKNAQNMKKLQKYRKFLQWFLCLFQSSMDQNILQSIIDKMDFNEQSDQSIKKNISRGNQLLTQVHKYLKQMKKIMIQIEYRNKQQQIKDKQGTKVEQAGYNKIWKITKQRTLLYEVIDTLYAQCLAIYSELKGFINGKRIQLYDIQSKGVKLFDRNIHKNVLLYYHCLNKINVVGKMLKDANLNRKTQNYICDDILQPFQNRLLSFVKFNEVEMLQLALRLQNAIQIEKNYKQVIKNWEQTMEKGKKKQQSQEQYRKRIIERSKQVIELGQQIDKIEELSSKKFVVLNTDEIKKIKTYCQQHVDASNQIIESQSLAEVCASRDYKNIKLNQAIKCIHKNFTNP